MKNYVMIILGILTFLAVPSCEKERTEYIECELEHLAQNSEWGEKVKSELVSLFIDIEELNLVQVYNTTGDVQHWSGYDYGNPEVDSRQIQVDFFDTDMVLIFKRFVNGKWTNSAISIPFNVINTAVLQYVTIVKGGQVIRRANNILIYVSDKFDPYSMDGSIANATAPVEWVISHSKFILQK